MIRMLSCVVTALCGGLIANALAAAPPATQPARSGPLAGLPGPPGPHIERIQALGDDAWLNLGPPAADPAWGRALGRSWTPKMAYAPELRGAFLAGEGNHGWVNPKTRRQMDDLWCYDINAHRWVCAYPGTDTANLDTAYTVNAEGFTATKDGRWSLKRAPQSPRSTNVFWIAWHICRGHRFTTPFSANVSSR